MGKGGSKIKICTFHMKALKNNQHKEIYIMNKKEIYCPISIFWGNYKIMFFLKDFPHLDIA